MNHQIKISKTLIAGCENENTNIDGENPINIFEGTWGDKQAAIKCIPRALKKKARIEMSAYEQLDEMSKIIRCLGVKEDKKYCYIALEKAGCNLSEFIRSVIHGDSFHENIKVQSFLLTNAQFQPWTDVILHPVMVKLIKDIIEAVAYLHKKGIRHLNLTPENILIFEDWQFGVCAKLANFTIHSSSLSDDILSVEAGTEGWRPPERLLHLAEGIKSDVFNFGLISYHCFTGEHPFGNIQNIFACERNIRDNLNQSANANLPPDAEDFLKHLLDPIPSRRPELESLLSHPFLWDRTKRSWFLCELYGWMSGLTIAAPEVQYLNSKYCRSILTLSIRNRYRGWIGKFNSSFITAVNNKGFNYNKANSNPDLRELLRFVRNVLQHYNDYPKFLGNSMESAYTYVLASIPDLIIVGYNIIKIGNLMGSDRFKAYFTT